MKKSIFLSSTSMSCFILLLLLVSCGHGLVPSWKNANKTVFSLYFSLPLQSRSTESRIIVQGSRFLYLRTVGGPLSETGNYYGPYTVDAGQVFSTTEIPAGRYQGIGVIYAATKPDPTKRINWVGGNASYSFNEFMNFSDTEFLIASDSHDFAFDDFFDSDACGNMARNVIIIPGQENTLRLTLEPMVSSSHILVFPEMVTGSTQTDCQLSSSLLKGQFVHLTNVPLGYFGCSFDYGVIPTIGFSALYDTKMNLIQKWASDVESREYHFVEGPQKFDLYFYIEYLGDVSLYFSVSKPW